MKKEERHILKDSPFKVEREDGQLSVVFSAFCEQLQDTLVSDVMVSGIMGSLLHEEFEGEFLTCGCGVPECAGFTTQKSRLFPEIVYWSICWYGKQLEFNFHRVEYEESAAKILKCLLEEKWTGETGCTYEYQDCEAFRHAVQNLVSMYPHLERMIKS